MAKAIDANPLKLAQKVASIKLIRGINQRIYKVRLSSLDDFGEDFIVDDCDFLYLETYPGGKFAIKTMVSWCIEKDVRHFQLVGDLNVEGYESWDQTEGGCIFSLLHVIESWPERENDATGNIARFLRGLPYPNMMNLIEARDPHEFFGLAVTDDFSKKKKRYKTFLYRSDPSNIKVLYKWMDESKASQNFSTFLATVHQITKTSWKEIENTRDEVLRPSKKRRVEDQVLDFSTFPLTHMSSFELKDSKAMNAILQNLFCDFISKHIICAENGQMWEKVHRNGVEYFTPDYKKEVTIENMGTHFINHARHLVERKHVDSCIFCRYQFGKNLAVYPEFEPFFEKAIHCMACKSAKNLFGEVRGNNDGKTLDKSIVAFMNVYFDIVNMRFIKLENFPNFGRIAVCNHTSRIVPDELILDEKRLKCENLFDLFVHKIKVFSSCLGQKNDVTKVILADVGSSFIARGEHDSYQKGTFILGPGGRGKSEFQKILRILHNPEKTMTPCQNTLGQKFSHGQFAGSLKTAFLPDEIHKDCGLSQQMWFNWVDQTEIQCELKYKQSLRTMPFVLYILWVANAFFPKFQISEALLRRAVVFDVNFFSFVKFSRTPASLVENEVRCV